MKFLRILLIWLGFAFVGNALAADEAPDTLIRRLSDDVLATLKAEKATLANNPKRQLELVDTKILPYVDFERMTRDAVGRFWRRATPDQQQQLMKEFRTTLVRTYSGAIEKVSDQQVQMRPFRGDVSAGDVVVRTFVVQPKGDPVQLDYRMEKTPKGWKIYDVNVLGIWLVENYRNQFAQQINEKGVDGLIALLADKNRAFEQGMAQTTRTN